MADWTFHKMHGLGNDFVVLDRRAGGPGVTPALVRALADRRRGVGFDQLAVIEPATDADVRLRFWNADGSTAGACGNATRCIARHLMAAAGTDRLTLRTDHTAIAARDLGGGQTAVNLGAPVFDWQAIPLARAADVTALPIPGAPAALSMGNPHCVFRVDDLAAVDIHEMGPAHETHPLFPERTNVEAVQVLGRDRIRILIWERGTGATLASGSCAAAAAVACARAGWTGHAVTVAVPGGALPRKSSAAASTPTRPRRWEEAMKRRRRVEDAVVVNTCAVTAEAVRKARQDIRRLRRENPGAR
jgi:diaminopimelate epimerase